MTGREAPPAWARATLAAVALAVFTAAGSWLGLSYLGVISRDVRVQASVPSLGDSLGPGAKVRYQGIIVGRVMSVDRDVEGFGAELLIKRDLAPQIPSDVRARVLPSTLFGSEYVELVGGTVDEPVTQGAVLAADTSAETVRLMDSYDTAERLLAAIDPEDIEVAVSGLAAALDGNGQNVADFVGRARELTAAFNARSDQMLDDMAMAADVADLFADIEPRLVSALEHTRTPAATFVELDHPIARLLAGTTALTDRGTGLARTHSGTVVAIGDSFGTTTQIASRHLLDIELLLGRVPIVLHNGANSVDDAAIQMDGMIGLDPLDPYDAGDCPRYGALRGSNCGNVVPHVASADDRPSALDPSQLVSEIERLLDSLGADAADPDDDAPTSDATVLETEPGTGLPASGTEPLRHLFDVLGGLLGWR